MPCEHFAFVGLCLVILVIFIQVARQYYNRICNQKKLEYIFSSNALSSNHAKKNSCAVFLPFKSHYDLQEQLSDIAYARCCGNTDYKYKELHIAHSLGGFVDDYMETRTGTNKLVFFSKT
jgi:hypothetical protein